MADNSCHRYLVVMKSMVDIRFNGSESTRSANLVAHQSITNIFHQPIKLSCILGVVEETGEILLGCHRVQCLKDLLQFPSNTHVSPGLALDVGKYRLTVPVFSLSLPH